MKAFIKYLFLASVLLLIPVLFLPVWTVYLEAPQYPEPIGMYIFIDKIQGINENDLDNINLLNHYIGMKKIIPESIPELKYMKYGVYAFIFLGIAAFISKKKQLFYTWTVMLILSSALTLYDFNKWEIDYGSNLDPKAPIKVPGMTYKPPLIGQKQLLNITATSLPSWGGILLITSILFSSCSVVMIYYRERQLSKYQKYKKMINSNRIKYVTSNISGGTDSHHSDLELEKPFI